jgi:hypothetical protein
MIALFIVQNVVIAFVFFYLGKHQERIEWNKLIKDGILPKPIQEGKTKSNTKQFTGKGRQAPPPPIFKRTKQQEQFYEEQIKDAYKAGYNNGNIDTCLTSEQYYNETFKQQEQ